VEEPIRVRLRFVAVKHLRMSGGTFDWTVVATLDLDAQHAINGTQLIDEQSEIARIFSSVFTAAFPFEAPVRLPDLAPERLLAFCNEEYGTDGSGMVEALEAAHAFYRRGIAEVTPEQLVVFVIS
jgi:hypothetical protein